MVEYPGIGLSDKEFKSEICVKWKPNAKYSWSAGTAIGKFLTELKNGKLVGRKCYHCNRVLIPPRMFCERCYRPTDEWVELKDTGTVNTFAISYIGYDRSDLKEPLIPAVIEIDGASPGMGILHLIGEVKPENVKIGMKVQAVWKSPDKRDGNITDILYFKPLEEETKEK